MNGGLAARARHVSAVYARNSTEQAVQIISSEMAGLLRNPLNLLGLRDRRFRAVRH
jgi:hypothetical protein